MVDTAAAGFRCHSGWAVLVTASGSDGNPVLGERRRLELIDSRLPRQPYHAVAEEGAPRSVVGQVEQAALESATAALRAIGPRAVGVVAADRRIPDDLDAILRSHARLHAAEGRLYEQAVIDAAAALKVPVTVVEPATISVSTAIEALGRTVGAPWQKDHKWAMVAALAALRAG